MPDSNPESLRDEIVAAYQDGWKTPAEIVQRLRTPARVAVRGRDLSLEDLVEAILENWKIKPNSRWLLVDLDEETVPMQSLSKSYENAVAFDGACDSWAVKRIDL